MPISLRSSDCDSYEGIWRRRTVMSVGKAAKPGAESSLICSIKELPPVGLFQIGASLTLESTAISSGLLGCTVPELFGGLEAEPTPVDIAR